MTTTKSHGQCPVCRRKVALNRQGLLRAHIVPIIVNRSDPGNTSTYLHLDNKHRCDGSYGPPGTVQP